MLFRRSRFLRMEDARSLSRRPRITRRAGPFRYLSDRASAPRGMQLGSRDRFFALEPGAMKPSAPRSMQDRRASARMEMQTYPLSPK